MMSVILVVQGKRYVFEPQVVKVDPPTVKAEDA